MRSPCVRGAIAPRRVEGRLCRGGHDLGSGRLSDTRMTSSQHLEIFYKGAVRVRSDNQCPTVESKIGIYRDGVEEWFDCPVADSQRNLSSGVVSS